jgi:hypothetical protein
MEENLIQYDWLNELEIFETSEIIKNPYSGEEVELLPEAVAVYDLIKGCELLLKNQENAYISKQFYEALDYFRIQWPNEYMILLD